MGKIKDIAGIRFGKLIVVEPTNRRGPNGAVYWMCKCDCGKDHIASTANLRNGSTKSCGCLHAEIRRKAIKNAHIARRTHFGCLYCGSDKHYAKGCCRSCYGKLRRGTLE